MEPDLLSFLEENAARLPAQRAYADPCRSLTWRDLRDEVTRVTSFLAGAGVVPGVPVLLCLPSDVTWIATFLALRCCGCVVVPEAWTASVRELEMTARTCKVRFAVTTAEKQEELRSALEAFPAPVLVVSDTGTGPRSPAPLRRTLGPALVHQTSGSSGLRKWILRDERNLVDEARAVAAALRLVPRDGVLCTTPVHHSFASGLALASLSAGAACWLLPKFRAATTVKWLTSGEITILAGVPYVYQVLSTITVAAGTRASALRAAISGGAHLPRPWVKAFEQRFGLSVHQEYGLSEGGIVSLEDLLSLSSASVGTAIPGVRISIVDPEDPARTLPDGTVGEVLVERQWAPRSYMGASDESARTFLPDGRVRTGDLGRVDEAGRLHLIGRLKQMINVSGTKVAPREVEDVLLSFPTVQEAVVVGLPDRLSGESVAAAVVFRPGEPPSTAELRSFCRGRLSDYKTPRRFTSLECMPRTTTGKIDREAIVRTMQAADDQSVNGTDTLRAVYERANVVFSGRFYTTVNEFTDQIPALRPEVLRMVTNLAMKNLALECDKLLVEEEKGAALGAALSLATGIPLAMARSYPYEIPSIKIAYDSEYVGGHLYVNGVEPNDRVVIVEDTISTGGVLTALIRAVQGIGARVHDALAIVEKVENGGVARVLKETGVRVKTLLRVRVEKDRVVVVEAAGEGVAR